MKIIMSPKEIETLTGLLEASEHYFEFGMGGSTCLAARTVAGSVTAIDSDADWIEKVRQEIGQPDKDVTLKHVDIGPTGNWGTPIGTGSRDSFPRYSTSIRAAKLDVIDFCLVDGRFRIACFLEALGQLRSDALLAIHDYAVRPEYHLVEEFARPILTCQQLTVFVRRMSADRQRIAEAAEEFRYDPR